MVERARGGRAVVPGLDMDTAVGGGGVVTHESATGIGADVARSVVCGGPVPRRDLLADLGSTTLATPQNPSC